MADKKVAIKDIPDKAPSNVALEVTYNRTQLNAKATWKIPKSYEASDKKNSKRFEGVVVMFTLKLGKFQKKKEKAVSGTTIKKKTAKALVNTPKKKSKKATVQSKEITKNKQDKTTTKTEATPIYYMYKVSGTNTLSKTLLVDLDDNKFYPNTLSGYTLMEVRVDVQGYNSKSGGGKLWNANVTANYASYEVKDPNPPAITRSYNPNTRVCTFNIVDGDNGKGHIFSKMTYKVEARLYHKDMTYTKINHSSLGKSTTTHLTASPSFAFTGANITIGTDERLDYRVTKLIAYGIGGFKKGKYSTWDNPSSYSSSSADTDTSTNTIVGVDAAQFTWAYPHVPKITSVTKSGDLVTINFKKTGTNRLTDYFKLEVAVGHVPDSQQAIFNWTEEQWLNDVTANGSWTEIGDSIGSAIRSLTRNYQDDRPGINNRFGRTYYRIRAYNNVFTTHLGYASIPKALDGYLSVPSAKNETVDFLQILSGDDGVSVKITLAYQVTYVNVVDTDTDDEEDDDSSSAQSNDEETVGDPNSDGTIISWSTNPNAWRSNSGANSFDMPDKDISGHLEFQQEDTDEQWITTNDTRLAYLKTTRGFNHTSLVYIDGLTEGEKYYFKAQRYLEATDDHPRTFGPRTDYTGDLATMDDPGVTGMQYIQPATKPTIPSQPAYQKHHVAIGTKIIILTISLI